MLKTHENILQKWQIENQALNFQINLGLSGEYDNKDFNPSLRVRAKEMELLPLLNHILV